MTGSSRGRRAYAGALIAVAATMVVTLFAFQRVGAAPVTLNSTCTMPAATATQFGLTQISGPIKTQVTTTPLDLQIPGDITATAVLAPGGTIHTTGSMTLDIQSQAQDILINQVKPAILAAQNQTQANYAFLEMTLSNMKASFPIPAGVTASNPTASSTPAGSPASSAAIVGSDLVVSIDTIKAGAYQTTPVVSTTSSTIPTLGVFTVNLDVDGLVDPATPSGTTIVLHPGPITFNLKFLVGTYMFGSPAIGGVNGVENCVPADRTQVLASTDVVGAGTTSTSSTSSSTSSTTSSTSSTTTSSTSTTSTSTTTTPSSTTTTAAPTSTTSSTSTSTTTSTTSTTLPAPGVTVSPSTIEQGAPFTLASSGWKPGSNVEATLNSTPVTLGTLVADATGSVNGTFNVPAGFELGAHTVNLSGTSSANVAQTLSASITVIAQTTTTTAPVTPVTTAFTTTTTGALPTTGSSTLKLVTVAFVLLGAGGAVVVVRRRRSPG